jgi:hypothetical protein
MVGGIALFLIDRQLTTDSIALAAPIVCPIIDFMELTGMSLARSLKTDFMANVSIMSFNGVPVPWALM